jgi:hypothetical protein
MALAAAGHHRVAGNLTAGKLFFMSDKIGKRWSSFRESLSRPSPQTVTSPFRIVQ